jgi:hypothetical protein
MKKINKSIQDDGFVILPGAKAIVVGNEFKKSKDARKDEPALPINITALPYSVWGDDNLFPQNVLDDLAKNSVACQALEKRTRVHFGRGIIAYREIKDASGNTTREKVTDPEVVNFFNINHINYQWPKFIHSLEVFYNGWLEIILNKGKDHINRVFYKDPAYCRLSQMNRDTLKIEILYFSAQWRYIPNVITNNKVVQLIPMWDPDRYDGITYPDPKFAIQQTYLSFENSYYSLAGWNGVRVNKWMDIAALVPVMKKAIMQNQVTIKYHVTIPDFYFEKKFPASQYTVAQRNKEIEKVIDELNDFLTDVENSGKSFVSFSFYDQAKQKMMEGWQINVIDNKLADGAYLPDSQAANSEILFGIGIDPCLIGGSYVPGGKLGSGSGSDKREAYWMLNADMGVSRMKSLEPLYFIRDFNKWDPAIQFDYVVVDTSQTQNQHPSKINQNVDQNQE